MQLGGCSLAEVYLSFKTGTAAYSSSKRCTGTRAWAKQVPLACRWMEHPQQRAGDYSQYLVHTLYVSHSLLSFLVRTKTVVCLSHLLHFKYILSCYEGNLSNRDLTTDSSQEELGVLPFPLLCLLPLLSAFPPEFLFVEIHF